MLFFWMNVDKNVSLEEIGAALEPIARRNMGQRQPVNMQGAWSVGATAETETEDA